MNEQEWLSCQAPERMLALLGARAGGRKLRLFACALYRSSPRLPGDDRCRAAVDTAENFVGGLAGRQELEGAWEAAQRAKEGLVAAEGWAMAWLAWLAQWACGGRVSAAAWVSAAARRHEWGRELWEERPGVQCALLRDIFGPLPFRPVTVEPALLRWNDGCVRKVAQGIYDERAFGRMGILADALTDAGCGNDDILRHCRRQEGHVRGCWVLDLLTGRE